MTKDQANRPVAAAAAASCAACPVRHLGVCDALSDAEINKLNAIMTDVRYAPGQSIIQDGDPADWVYIITAGHLKLYKLLIDGRRQITGFLAPGDIAGIYADDTYSYSAEAIGQVALCRIPRKKMNALSRELPGLPHRMLSMVSHDLAEAQSHLLLLGRKNARERLSSFLLAFAGRRDQSAHAPSGALRINLPMTRADIADYLGVTIETVSRAISELKRDGIIVLRHRNLIEIPSLERLECAAEGA